MLDSQGNTHHSASEQESLPQETDSDWFSHPTASQPDIEVDDKTSVNQKALLNKVFDAMFKMDITRDTTLEEILKAVDVPLKEYEQALKHSKSSNGIILKRKPCEHFINNYNPKILSVWEANMDIQYVSCPYGCVMYVSSYVTKPEHEMSELLEQTSKQSARM